MTRMKCGYALLFSLLLAACGGGSPTGSTTVNLSGTAAKGLLAGATVQAYEVVNGELRTLGQPTVTDEQGAYSLNLPSTDNPVIVKVTATAQTTMLDETGPLLDGKFPKVQAPVGLELRTMVDSLTQTRQAHANTFTEMAIRTASSFKDVQNAPLPISREMLIRGQTVITEKLGTNPFTVKVLNGISSSASEDEKKLTALLAGVVQQGKNASASCTGDATGITCAQPEGLVYSVKSDGTVTPTNEQAIDTKLTNLVLAIPQVNNEFARQAILAYASPSSANIVKLPSSSTFPTQEASSFCNIGATEVTCFVPNEYCLNVDGKGVLTIIKTCPQSPSPSIPPQTTASIDVSKILKLRAAPTFQANNSINLGSSTINPIGSTPPGSGSGSGGTIVVGPGPITLTP